MQNSIHQQYTKVPVGAEFVVKPQSMALSDLWQFNRARLAVVDALKRDRKIIELSRRIETETGFGFITEFHFKRIA